MLTLLALSFAMNTGPTGSETNQEVFEALVFRNGWNYASLLVHDEEGFSNDEEIVFQWRWNLALNGTTLEQSVELAKQRTKKLWERKDNPPESPLSSFIVDGIDIGPGLSLPLEVLDPDQNHEFDLHVEIRNGREIIEIENVEIVGNSVVFGFPQYGSRIEASLNEYGRLEGEWIKERGEKGVARVPFDASVQNNNWCPVNGMPLSMNHRAKIEGRWAAEFSESGPAIGDFELINPDDTELENSRLLGTFLTPTGDFRYLAGEIREGDYSSNRLFKQTQISMSTFDGAHAFLFTGRIDPEGAIHGDFYSGNWHHETWTAVRDDEATLPDAFEQTVIADEEALAEAVFKDLEGEPTRVLDVLDESNAKARIIEIFGTWCPNCSDAGRELVSLKEQYGDDLAIVGLAFEITEDFERSAEQVKRHHEHIGTSWPILIAGLSDKDKATASLGFLDQVRSYPTLVFLNEANEVQAVYSGFSGPATGEAYKEQRLRFEALIDGMIE